MEFFVIFWAEKLILGIIYQFLPGKAKINICTLRFSTIQLSIVRFLGDPITSIACGPIFKSSKTF
jgi:hypothetical protein